MGDETDDTWQRTRLSAGIRKAVFIRAKPLATVLPDEAPWLVCKILWTNNEFVSWLKLFLILNLLKCFQRKIFQGFN